jgi:glycosyltransferase involved in cell wall biosynthesis
MPRVLMLFNRPRAERLAAAQAGLCPDELLYGLGALRQRGWDVVASDAGFDRFLGLRLLRALDDRLGRGGRRTGFNLAQAWRLRGLMNEADVVFATADSSGMPALCLQDLGVVRRPIVVASIGLAETFGAPRGLVHRAYRRWLRRASRIIVYAAPEAAALTQLFALDRGQVRFAPFGVDAEFFAGDAPPSGRPLAFGFDHRRDWPTLFAAAASLAGEMDVVANPDVLRGLSAPRNVRLLPPEPVHELRRRMQAASFVVLPVRENGYTGGTISLLQAMAAGRAVVVSRTRAIAEGYGLRDGENCLLTPPGDVAALASAMRRLQNDAALAAQLGRAGAAHVRAGFTIARLADDLDAALREAIA